MMSDFRGDMFHREFDIFTGIYIYIYIYKSSYFNFFYSLCFIGNLTISMFHREFDIYIYIYIYNSPDFFFFDPYVS